MYGQEVTFSHLPDELRTRRRRLLLLVIGVIVLLAAGLVAMLALAPGGRARPDAGTAGLGSAGLGGAPLVPGGGGETPAPTEDPDPDGGSSGEDGDGGGGDGDGPAEPATGPCAGWDRDLAGAPDPVRLKLGATAGSFTIYNCTDKTVPWIAATRPSVTLSDEAGELAPGATHELGFTVDTSKFDTPQFTFKIQVRGESTNYFYIDVYGTKLGIAPNA